MRSPMRVEASHFLNTPGRVDRRRWVMPMAVEMPLSRTSEARVDMVVEGCDDGIRLRGTVAYHMTVNCYRCLEGWERESVITLERTVRSHPRRGRLQPARGRVAGVGWDCRR